MAPVGHTALAPAITNHLRSPSTSLPPTVSSITTRDNASDAATARRKKKEKLRNILIITINPLTIILVILVVYWSARAITRHIRYVRRKRKAEREERQREKEGEGHWTAIYDSGSSNNVNTSGKTKALGNQTPLPIIDVVDDSHARRGFSGYVSIMPSGSAPTTTTATPLTTSEKIDTYERTNINTDRTTLAVDVATAKKIDDSSSLGSGRDTSPMTAADEKIDLDKDMDN